MKHIFKNAAVDLPASIVVFLVAIPLCLGIAVASDAAPITGVVGGIVGGILVGMLSGSHLSVSGPAAGLTAIVAAAIGKLPSYEAFLVAVVIAGILQIILGYLKAGIIGDFFPNSVIRGMLAAIGLILILKQVPHLLGYDVTAEGSESFQQEEGGNTFTTLIAAFSNYTPGAVVIGIVAMAILFVFELKFIKKLKIFQLLPGALFAVATGILLKIWFDQSLPYLRLNPEHLVQLEAFKNPLAFFQSLPSPDFSFILHYDIWITAFTIALIASIETLLSIEAVDKIDPLKRLTPTNRELKAQGIGNMVSGLLGGLPITSVIVRSSANVNAGGISKLSAVAHGFWILLSVLFIPNILGMIPLSALAAILILTGYKLANAKLFTEYYRKGWNQFLPFIISIVAILLSDLLKGIFVGMIVGVYYILKSNFQSSIYNIKDQYRFLMRFGKEVTFLNKASLKENLAEVKDNTSVLIDATKSEFIDDDIIDLINDFIINTESRNIRVYIKYKGGVTKKYFKDIKGGSIV
jgi:MFS superfamily sulfate permease-like transporter